MQFVVTLLLLSTSIIHFFNCFVVHLVMYFNPDQLNFQRFSIQKDNLPSLVKFGYRNHANLLGRRTFDRCGVESGLVANEVDMWAFVDDELIFLLKWIAPFGLIC